MNPSDRAILRPRPAPIRAADFRPEWLHQVRGIVIRDGHRLRPGFPANIEVKSSRGWMPLMLPNSGIEFATTEDRDTVLAMLTGDAALPALPPKLP